MELITLNLSVGGVKRVTVKGRDWFVAPLTTIVPGVLSGSQGSLRYTPKPIKESTPHWNGIPILVYHPTHNGQNVPANYPGIWQKQGIGYLWDSVYNGQLQHMGRFDVKKTQQVDKRVYNTLDKCARQQECTPMEVSTGLYTNNIPMTGTYNGKSHQYDARDYQPDHLAILPDQIGACSVRDGCGLLVNQVLSISGSYYALQGGGKDGCSEPDG